MTSAGFNEEAVTEERKRRYAFPLLVVCVVGAVIRIVIGYHGGIWADEGFFLLVANAPSWSGMMSFLRLHESHPPLFYAIMRVWMSVVGTGDTAALMLPVAIGIAIVPAMYVSGARLFSRRAGLMAAGLGTISPALLEFSGQFRPYGLLPLLTLISCTTLAMAIDRGRLRVWCFYVMSTTMLVYTHHWAWLVVGGQVVAVASLWRGIGVSRKSAWREPALAWTVIFLLYVPWFATLIFQVRHAGHPAIVVETMGQAFGLVALSLPAASVMTLFGSLSDAGSAILVLGLVVAIIAIVLVAREGYMNVDVAGRIFLIVPAVAIILVVLLSSQTNLLLPRCIAMLSPLVLVLIAHSADEAFVAAGRRRWKTIAVGVVATISLVSVAGSLPLARTTRSNVREVATALSGVIQPSDLVIVAPEWYAASFSHYFHTPVDEIDYPNDGRGGMVDFSHVFERVTDNMPIAKLANRIRSARARGQRVWLITERTYVQRIDLRTLARARTYRDSPKISIYRVGQIVDSLRLAYGDPDTTLFVHGETARYDEVLPFLFAPLDSLRTSPDSVRR